MDCDLPSCLDADLRTYVTTIAVEALAPVSSLGSKAAYVESASNI